MAYAPISFDPALPDARIKNRADGSILGDDVYNTDRGPVRRAPRPVPPGSTWTYAVQVQNDGPAVDSFTIHAAAAAPPFTVRYFSGYFDITSTVTGQGATLKNLSPGQVRTIAVDIRVAADAPCRDAVPRAGRPSRPRARLAVTPWSSAWWSARRPDRRRSVLAAGEGEAEAEADHDRAAERAQALHAVGRPPSHWRAVPLTIPQVLSDTRAMATKTSPSTAICTPAGAPP